MMYVLIDKAINGYVIKFTEGTFQETHVAKDKDELTDIIKEVTRECDFLRGMEIPEGASDE